MPGHRLPDPGERGRARAEIRHVADRLSERVRVPNIGIFQPDDGGINIHYDIPAWQAAIHIRKSALRQVARSKSAPDHYGDTSEQSSHGPPHLASEGRVGQDIEVTAIRNHAGNRAHTAHSLSIDIDRRTDAERVSREVTRVERAGREMRGFREDHAHRNNAPI
jgi:hypothetical protein